MNDQMANQQAASDIRKQEGTGTTQGKPAFNWAMDINEAFDLSSIVTDPNLTTTNPIRADPNLIVSIYITPPAPIPIDPVKNTREHTHHDVYCTYDSVLLKSRKLEIQGLMVEI
jgi:hypothetical protein